jgi:hypothetical protein
MSKIEYRQSPVRAPHWRWLRAAQIERGGRRSSRALDGPHGVEAIRRAVRLRRHLSRVGTSSDGHADYAMMLHDGPMYWAHDIWTEDKKPTRWAIEARVVAGESDEEIAHKLGTDVEVINAYTTTFYDVRDKLENVDYVVNVILGDAVSRGLSERHYDLLWKMVAYQGGTHALTAVMTRFIPAERPKTSEDVANFFQEAAINCVKYKAALATMTVPINTHTQLELINSFVKYVEVERTTENSTKAQMSIMDNIGAMLKSMPLTIGTKLESKKVKLGAYDEGAAELRGDEIIVAASGAAVPDADTIQNLKFPGED